MRAPVRKRVGRKEWPPGQANHLNQPAAVHKKHALRNHHAPAENRKKLQENSSGAMQCKEVRCLNYTAR
jgi:hypothetical protein